MAVPQEDALEADRVAGYPSTESIRSTMQVLHLALRFFELSPERADLVEELSL